MHGKARFVGNMLIPGLYYFDLVITRELHEYNCMCVLLVD